MFKPFLQFSNQLLQNLQTCQLCELEKPHFHSICADCWQQLPWLNQQIQRQEIDIQVACEYRYPINRIIQKFKYEQHLHFQNLLAGTLLELRLPKVQAIVPMPISTTRLFERGYNQSLVIAKIVARHLNVPIWQPISRLEQHSQKGLTRLERLEHIEQQFHISTDSKRCYRRVLIVDDVVTTASSIHALKQKLEQLGCQKVYASCIAAAKS